VVLLALILPFTIRNYLAYGEFLLLNSNTGYAMYSAQHPDHGVHFREFWAAPLPQDLRGQGLNEAQWDRVLMRRGLQFVRQDPWRYLRLSWSRVFDYFEFWPTPGTSLLHNVGRVVSFGLYLPFMIYGLYLGVQRAKANAKGFTEFVASSMALILLFAIFYPILHILTWAMPRYRLPVDAVMMPFVALAVVELWERWVPRRWRERVITGLVFEANGDRAQAEYRNSASGRSTL
jgi:hypothetical protein